MASLTENTRGYEFELEQGVILQYDAHQIGHMVAVSDVNIVIQADSFELYKEITGAFDEWYNDDAALDMECEKDFRKNHMYRTDDDF